MVSIKHSLPAFNLIDTARIETWLQALDHVFTSEEMVQIQQACALAEPLYADQQVITGSSLMSHALGTASILISINMDANTIAAAILHAVPVYQPDWETIILQQFGQDIHELVAGIAHIEQIRQFNEIELHEDTDNQLEQHQQIEGLRKMLLAMVSDIRVVLIKLAERVQTMRTLDQASPGIQLQIARETHYLFAPLANRLGVWQIKWELEDRAVRLLEPKLYKKIARLLDERRIDREQYITRITQQLEQALSDAGLKAEVAGRPKHIYSIINKMKLKKLSFDQLYDVRALRILVENIEQCYTSLSIVHQLWEPINSEYDDYIAQPKGNNYRSLHTAVKGPGGKPVEIQIRTHQMHYDSELGIAAHWRYKEKSQSDSVYDEKIAWLRQLLAWKDDLDDQEALQQQFKNKLFQDRVYVLTPKGKVLALSQGATPVDFAYALHTSVGHRTKGAKVDGRIVPLNYKLQNAERVEILTGKQESPSRDWANPALGYLASARARAKVRNWFNQQDQDQYIHQGKTMLEHKIQRLGIDAPAADKLARQMHFNKTDTFLAAVGRGSIAHDRLNQLLNQQQRKPAAPSRPATGLPEKKSATANAEIIIGGEDNLLTRLARCCHPEPGDPIVGYITRDRGIMIHHCRCAFIQKLSPERQQRILTARWQIDESS